VERCSEEELKALSETISGLLWGDFALLIQIMASGFVSIKIAPMSGEALKTNKFAAQMFWRPKLLESGEISTDLLTRNYGLDEQIQLQSRIQILYKGMLYCLRNALKIEPDQWLYLFRQAHAFRKLGHPPTVVVETYLKCLSTIPRENLAKDPDILLEIVYKSVVYLLKAYLRNTLDVLLD
jgi:hypothetical protein